MKSLVTLETLARDQVLSRLMVSDGHESGHLFIGPVSIGACVTVDAITHFLMWWRGSLFSSGKRVETVGRLAVDDELGHRVALHVNLGPGITFNFILVEIHILCVHNI